ncbi:SpdD-like protein [Streptomyces tirandamycinicus]|uniref:SpdD-like protein n=1 Tax=Streptomyces tirandamycinicus TaxID=2174846 RepID=A0A2S1SVJ2_9ACTN|nr:SpdD-like protein [Streptomyces tirandamycinicus]AWI30423.1 SpdD-like protein [Streptomyces tirandamycinicus]
MTYPTAPQSQPGEPYVLTDAFGRTFVSSAPPASGVIPFEAPVSAVQQCFHDQAPLPAPQRSSLSPVALVAVGAGIALGVGTALVALLLSVAVVAASVAVAAMSLTVCAVVLRSMVNSREPRGRYRR